jgi:hypothetical protein
MTSQILDLDFTIPRRPICWRFDTLEMFLLFNFEVEVWHR